MKTQRSPSIFDRHEQKSNVNGTFGRTISNSKNIEKTKIIYTLKEPSVLDGMTTATTTMRQLNEHLRIYGYCCIKAIAAMTNGDETPPNITENDANQ